MIAYPVLSLRYKFEITEIGEETVAVCLEDGADAFHGIIKLQNDSAVFMFRRLKDGITVHDLIAECMDRYSETVEQTGPAVKDFINMMYENNLIKVTPCQTGKE